MSMYVVFQQIAIIFGYVLVGWAACKFGVLDDTRSKMFSDVIVKLTVPFSVIAAANVEASSADLGNMAITAGVLFLYYLLPNVATVYYGKAKGIPQAKRAAYASLISYPNCAFIGIPLCVALMGERAMLYGAAMMVAFNLTFFTYQYIQFNPGEKVQLKLLLTPLNASTLFLALCLVFGWRLPTVVQTVTYNIGAMTTPLALLVVGIMLAQGDILSVLRSKVSYVLVLLRNLVLPLVFLVVLALLPLDSEMKMTTFIYAACPCGTLTAVFATQSNMEPELCGKTILLSTLMFAATLPFLLWLAQMLFV